MSALAAETAPTLRQPYSNRSNGDAGRRMLGLRRRDRVVLSAACVALLHHGADGFGSETVDAATKIHGEQRLPDTAVALDGLTMMATATATATAKALSPLPLPPPASPPSGSSRAMEEDAIAALSMMISGVPATAPSPPPSRTSPAVSKISVENVLVLRSNDLLVRLGLIAAAGGPPIPVASPMLSQVPSCGGAAVSLKVQAGGEYFNGGASSPPLCARVTQADLEREMTRVASVVVERLSPLAKEGPHEKVTKVGPSPPLSNAEKEDVKVEEGKGGGGRNEKGRAEVAEERGDKNTKKDPLWPCSNNGDRYHVALLRPYLSSASARRETLARLTAAYRKGIPTADLGSVRFSDETLLLPPQIHCSGLRSTEETRGGQRRRKDVRSALIRLRAPPPTLVVPVPPPSSSPRSASRGVSAGIMGGQLPVVATVVKYAQLSRPEICAAAAPATAKTLVYSVQPGAPHRSPPAPATANVIAPAPTAPTASAPQPFPVTPLVRPPTSIPSTRVGSHPLPTPPVTGAMELNEWTHSILRAVYSSPRVIKPGVRLSLYLENSGGAAAARACNGSRRSGAVGAPRYPPPGSDAHARAHTTAHLHPPRHLHYPVIHELTDWKAVVMPLLNRAFARLADHWRQPRLVAEGSLMVMGGGEMRVRPRAVPPVSAPPPLPYQRPRTAATATATTPV